MIKNRKILLAKFVMAHKVQVTIGICSIVAVVTAVKLLVMVKERNEIVYCIGKS